MNPACSIAGPDASEVELMASAYGGSTIVHTELGVDVLCMSAHGRQRHVEMAGDGRAVQVRGQEAEHVSLPITQGDKQTGRSCLARGCEGLLWTDLRVGERGRPNSGRELSLGGRSTE